MADEKDNDIIRGTIRANPARGFPVHNRADIEFSRDQAREFVVDPSARAVINEHGKPLVLPPRIYENLMEANGAALVVTHSNAPNQKQAQRIADLERVLAEDRERAAAEMIRLGQVLAQMERERDEARGRVNEVEQQLTDLRISHAAAAERVADLEKQLAEAQKPRSGRGGRPE